MERLLRELRARDDRMRGDGQLLGEFLAHRDEDAFAALVRRLGPMVLGVCRRVLGNEADAEDAFQATFLVLLSKGHALAARPVLGDWLHGVARNTACACRRSRARRRAKERAAAKPEARAEPVADDRLALLDQELARLPEKYRLPIVLCELEGRTRKQAAADLGWPEGTVAGRLARGRALLAKRLAQRGLTLSAGSLAACVPAGLAASTARAARGVVPVNVTALVKRVLTTMLLTKLQRVAAVLLLVAILWAGATGVLAYPTRPGESAPGEAKRKTDLPANSSRKDQGRPEKADLVKPRDLLNIHVTGTLPDAPIRGVYQVEASGKVALGVPYGRVVVGGLTLERAEVAIAKHLASFLRALSVSVSRPVPVTAGELERRVRRLEKEVESLRGIVEGMRKKPKR
jgi:RNA polymerase sigma factor (sigma-70 family)